MLKLLKKCALLLLMFILPVQSLHALAMPVCNQVDQATTVQQYSHDGNVAGHEDDRQTSDINLTYDGCSMCHTCPACAIASNVLDVSLDIAATLQATPGSSVTLFIPEQPQRPPFAVFA